MLASSFTTLSLALTGLLAGVFLCSGMVEHSARKLEAASWLDYKQAKETVFGPVMPAFFGCGLIATMVATVFMHAELPLVAASFLLLIVLAITVLVHVPLNKQIQTWPKTAVPAGWTAVRGRWRNWNWLRTVLATVAFGLVLAVSRT